MAFTFILYTMAEVAQLFNIEKETLRNRIKAAELTIHKVGKLDLITEDELNRLKKIPEPPRGRPAKRRK